jgi:hypothetical protein
VKKAKLIVPLLAVLTVGVMLAMSAQGPEAATAQGASLSPAQHPAGTRILESCTSKVPAGECVREMVVMDWSPSGRFVKLLAPGFVTAGEWKLPRQVRIVELLAVPKAEPVSKKLPEMVLENSGRLRRDWQ